MKYTIEKCPNGYIVNGCFGNDVDQNIVIEEDGHNDEYGYHSLLKLFWLLSEQFVTISKHNSERLIMEVEKNDNK